MSIPTPPPNVYGSVASVAMQYGVPDSIWETVADAESGYNVAAVGDNGTSFGLFQLHQGGQLPSQYNNNPRAVFDPRLNAEIAMPAIARAWNNLKGSFNASSQSWWQSFAAQSGHPGGSPGQSVTNAEATRLQQIYGAGPPGTGDPCLGCGAVGSIAYTQCHIALAAKVGSIPACAQQGIQQNQSQIASAITDPIANALLAPIEQFISKYLPYIALFIFALVILFIGFKMLT